VSSGDLLASEILLAHRGGVGGAAAFVLLITAMIDLIVLAITIVNWAPHLTILVAIALVFALLATGIAITVSAKGISQLAGYDDVALVLAFVGLGAAGADYSLSQ
jgi:hypothetical protein